MKKLISFLIIAALFVCCMVPTVFAEENETASVYASGTVVDGKYVLTVSVSEASFATYGVKVGYDASVLTLETITQGSVKLGLYSSNVATAMVGDVSTVDAVHGGSLFTMTFAIKEGATCGSYGISLSGNVSKADGTNIGSFSGTTFTVEHTWGEWEVTTAPTCAEKGVETRTCSVCKATETREVEMVAHTWGEWKETTAPTCTEKGKETRTCSVCKATETRDVDAKGHTFDTKWSYDEKDHWYECTECDAVSDKAAHTFQWVTDRAATATKPGQKHEECTDCHYKRNYTEIVYEEDLDDTTPPTGDITPFITLAAVVVISMFASVAYVFKRKAAK